MGGEDVYGSPEHLALRATVRKFVQTELRRARASSTRWAASTRPSSRRMGELGMLGIRYDPKWGGQGLDYSYTRDAPRGARAAATTPACAMGITVQTDMATPSLHQFGSEELKRALPRAGDPRRDGGGDRRDRARRRLRRRRHQDARRARRRRLGHQRLEDLHHQRRDRRLALPARGDRSERRLRRLHADHRADRHARASATSSSTRSATAAPTPACSSSTTCACRSRTRSARSAAASSSR